MQGWIKIHRQLQDKAYINKPAYVSLWVNLLLLANHKEKEVMWNGTLTTIKRGQFITGRKELSKLTGIPETTIERILKVFKSGHQIEQQTYNKYRLITILNWDKHQAVDNKRTTNGQQTDTNKNVKNVKKISELKNSQSISSLIENNNKQDMSWNKQGDDADLEVLVDYDSGEITNTAPVKQKKYPNAPAVRKLFQEILGRNPANWKVNKTQLLACENLYTERTLEKVRSALEYYKDHEDHEYMPSIDSPYDLDSKWTKLGNHKIKYGN